ncbi:MAG: methylenetetrahydrofolate reductase [NAD(P)H] [Spirochaetales bacterium]|nr:methylenetetrahydrofolate reductase [NAD(P)H] [Spirochaetales bacterium]
MQIEHLFPRGETAFSFEFFPPRSEKASEELFETIRRLTPLNPSHVTITYGAGGSTREITRELVLRIHRETDLAVIPHLTCVGASRKEIAAILSQYREAGIKAIMALRGDMPEDAAVHPSTDFHHAADLVSFIKAENPDMLAGVAGFPEGHPETPNRLKEIDYLKMKADAGADFICTQMFFDNHDFFDFRERCEIAGITLPIVAGIMPVTSRKTMTRMSELAAGTRYPARLMKALSRAEDSRQFESIGIHWATEQVLDLLDRGVRGIHFYTLNSSKATISIYQSLGLIKSQS